MTAPTPDEAAAWAQHMVAADRWYLGRDHLAVLLAERGALRAELEQARAANEALREENRQLYVAAEAIGAGARSGAIPRFWESSARG